MFRWPSILHPRHKISRVSLVCTGTISVVPTPVYSAFIFNQYLDGYTDHVGPLSCTSTKIRPRHATKRTPLARKNLRGVGSLLIRLKQLIDPVLNDVIAALNAQRSDVGHEESAPFLLKQLNRRLDETGLLG